MTEQEPAESTRRPQGNAVAVVSVAVLALIALGALAGGGYLLVRQLGAASDAGFFAGGTPETDTSSSWPAADGVYPPELEDLDSLTAMPGDSFEAGSEPLIVGEDIPSGVYVAPDAAPISVDDGLSCYWTVSESADYSEVEYSAFGEVEDGTAMILAPEGYLVRTDPACGAWEAIDPATAFEGASGTTLTVGQYAVGRDVVPGVYLSVAVVDEGSGCAVFVGDHFGFEGNGSFADYVGPRGGFMLIELEAGDVVELDGCPPFEAADLDAVYAADDGADWMGDGRWLVGIDVRAGDYVGPVVDDVDVYCSASVWANHLGWEGGDPVDDVFYSSGEVPATITLEAGQLVDVRGCGTWERTGP